MLRGLAATAFFVGALVAAAPAFAQTPPATIQPGVTIQGIDVGGMTADEAKAAVVADVKTPFKLRFRARTLEATPWQLGVRTEVALAITNALAAAPPADVPLTVSLEFALFVIYLA